MQHQWNAEHVAINGVLPLNATRHDAIANLKSFGPLGHQRPNFDGFIYIHYAVPPYSAGISDIYVVSFVSLLSVCWIPCATFGDEVECRNYGGWEKLWSHYTLFVDQSSSDFEMM